MSARTAPMVIGRTENALRALLVRTLEPTGVDDYEAWVRMNADTAALTAHDAAELERARALVRAVTADLEAGIEPARLATCFEVLDLIRERATARTVGEEGLEPPTFRV